MYSEERIIEQKWLESSKVNITLVRENGGGQVALYLSAKIFSFLLRFSIMYVTVGKRQLKRFQLFCDQFLTLKHLQLLE